MLGFRVFNGCDLSFSGRLHCGYHLQSRLESSSRFLWGYAGDDLGLDSSTLTS
jgi:hypothetical protein